MAEDIKENEMQNGKPARLRDIDADGNSITPTMEEVTDALPGEQKYDRGVYYSLPKSIVSVHKPTGGNEIKTITLLKIGDYNTSHFNFFEIFTIPFYSNNHCLPGWCKVHYAPAGTLQSDVAHSECGCFSNLRQISYKGNVYLAIDILVNQYGSAYIALTGYHEDTSQIMDVTGDFTELQ